jgi:pimeloyl-ACP methyl ester carboxylesterase
MRAAFSSEVAASVRKQIAADNGAVKRIHRAWLETVIEPYQRFRVPVECETRIVDLQVVLDPSGAVAGLFHTAHVEPPDGPVKAAAPPSDADKELEAAYGGDWSGAIEIPGTPLPVVVHLVRTSGQWGGSFDSPAQGATGIPLGAVRVSGEGIEMMIQGITGSPTFRGKLAGAEIVGTFSQGGQSFPFRLGRGEAAPPARPQEPAGERSYREEEVRYEGAGVRLAGTLTLPGGKGPHPAALLLSGSGPQNRNSELMGHKPFLVLADHLTRAGIAVLRVDDRGVGGSTGDLSRSTAEDLAADALAGVRLLGARPEIAAGRVGLIGHSDGAIVAPLAASRSNAVAFVVLLAGPGVPGREVLVRQMALALRVAGVDEERIERSEAAERKLIDLILDGAERSAIESQLRRLIEAQGGGAADAQDEAASAAATRGAEQMTTPWFRSFLAHDPRPALRKLRVPALALIGGLDLQVEPDQNLPEIRKALAEAGNADATVLEVEGLNHLFQTAKTGSVSEYGAIEETIAPKVLDLVTDWILERFAGENRGGT